MRAALCLSGHVRTYTRTYAGLFENLVVPNSGWDFDVFISTWQSADTKASHQADRLLAWGEHLDKHIRLNPTDVADLQTKYRPVAIHVEPDRTFDVSRYVLKDRIASPIAWVSMTYKIKDCDRLRREYELEHNFRYDAVFRCRFDTVLPCPISLRDADLSRVYVPAMWAPDYHHLPWCNDTFAFSSGPNMALYAQAHDGTDAIYNDGIIFQPEIYMFEWLRRCGLTIEVMGIQLEIVR
jgi:hypothetical protein